MKMAHDTQAIGTKKDKSMEWDIYCSTMELAMVKISSFSANEIY